MVVAQNKIKDIEAMYPLSSTQKGILFQTLYHPEYRLYFDQFKFTIHGNLNPKVFEQAWVRLVERHPVLRTLFVWKNRKHPVQVVRKTVKLTWIYHDWQTLSPEAQKARMDAFIDSDRQQGAELGKAPLMRCALMQVAEEKYEFVWSFHHIILDGWSWPTLLKDVWAFYDSIKNNSPLSLTPSRPYRDYITWLQQQDLSEAETFWRKILEGLTASTPLVVDNYSKDQLAQTQTCLMGLRDLSTEATARLKSFAQQNHLTLSTLVQAAWALLLSRYSRESDVVFGVTVSGRPPELAGVESMVGLFINTLPARITISDTTDTQSWLEELQQQHIEREQYSYTPLVDIQSWSDIPAGQQLFDSIVVFENYPTTERKLPDNLYITDLQDIGLTNYPLTIVAIPGEQLSLRIKYNGDRFDADTIDRMLGHLETLLVGMVTYPAVNPTELPILTESEQQLLLVQWNQTESSQPITGCIHQLFQQQAEHNPHATAVVYADQYFTYQQLNQKANQLAHYLQDLGVKPDVPVGICCERSLEVAIAILAVLKAGGTCVPLDPNYPPERLALMLADSQPPVVLTQSTVNFQANYPCHLLTLDQEWDKIGSQSDLNPDSRVKPEDLAYIIYTSGSTGTPKGVAVPHRSLINLIEHHQGEMATAVGVLQFASLSFDVSYHEIVAAWAFGGTLYLSSEAERKDIDKLIQLLANHPIAKVILPVVLWQQIAEIYGTQTHLFANLREAIACGEQLQITQPMVEMFKGLPHCTLYNFYGPSEADLVTAYRFSDRPESWPVYPPIGKAAVNVNVYILDSKLQPVPIGIPGELYVSGGGLARGYFNRPEITAEKFIANPFSVDANSRLYKTGDLARYLPDGNIEFLGRIDSLVKVRGFRVELGEVEAALSKHPQVSQAVAQVFGESAREKYLVAYFIPQQKQTVTVEALRRFLQAQLPDYMMPSVFVEMESFELTPNGKVNRRALREPTTMRPSLGQAFVAPRTPTEEILAGIWQDVLGLERVGIHDNFFDLGGHSLRAMEAIALSRKALQGELSIQDFFGAPTIAEIAQHLETASHQSLHLDKPPLQPRPVQSGREPISYTQQEFWFFEQLYPGNQLYHLHLVYHLTGRLNVTALEQSLREIVRRHETLRSSFACVNGEVIYAIAPEPVYSFSVVDLRELPPQEREPEAKQQANAAIQHPFDFTQGPFLRSQLWQLDETEYVFLIATHHIVADGWSFGILLQELSTLYTVFCEGQSSTLSELPLQYADFAAWQRQWLQGQGLADQLTFWKQHLGVTPPVIQLPTDYPRPPRRTFTGSGETVKFSSALVTKLKRLCQTEGVTLYMAVLAAFKSLLFFYTGQEDIIVSSPIANRTQSEIREAIGFFVHLLPLRTHFKGNPSFRTLLRQVRSGVIDVYAHQEMPFIKLVEGLQPVRDRHYTLLTQVMFVLLNLPEQELSLTNLTVQPLELEKSDGRDIAEFDLNLYLTETSAGIEGSLFYRTDLFAATTITKMVKQFQVLLESVVTDPDRTLVQLRSFIEQTTEPIPQSKVATEESLESKPWGEPTNPTEVTLLKIWQGVLGLETISTNDNFFELGGYSTQLLQVVAKIQDIYSVEIPIATLFEYPTIAEMANVIMDLRLGSV
ncbi:MAG: amino acid adenylation domain-containing protein [Moorea sp. SIOASIH]|uniref:non-ribosomal peptide synthetase n=1 Tax=Moorena sp. SIOASIH TaxID=2607817 RepID=UPI0013B81A10|nr:non-ribosomal peptide synthetase [Moorena sp. SIOASIH]NEO40840.1 amino acid adenylation domain-containing protein [Moorena sp. SIOASIH]